MMCVTQKVVYRPETSVEIELSEKRKFYAIIIIIHTWKICV